MVETVSRDVVSCFCRRACAVLLAGAHALEGERDVHGVLASASCFHQASSFSCLPLWRVSSFSSFDIASHLHHPLHLALGLLHASQIFDSAAVTRFPSKR